MDVGCIIEMAKVFSVETRGPAWLITDLEVVRLGVHATDDASGTVAYTILIMQRTGPRCCIIDESSPFLGSGWVYVLANVLVNMHVPEHVAIRGWQGTHAFGCMVLSTPAGCVACGCARSQHASCLLACCLLWLAAP